MRYRDIDTGTSWYMIEDCIESSASIFGTKLKAKTKEEAFREAGVIWDKMSDHDRSKIDNCYIILSDEDESGVVEFDNAKEIYNFK